MKGLNTFFLILLIGLFGCSHSDATTKANHDHALSGTVYLCSIEFDSTNCSVSGPCDCCAAHLIFLDNQEFISVSYCTGDESYNKGAYTLNDSSLILSYGDQCVRNEYNWDKELDTTGSITNDYNTKIQSRKPLSIHADLFFCEDELCLKFGEEFVTRFGAKDTLSVSTFIHQLKEKDIWNLLNND